MDRRQHGHSTVTRTNHTIRSDVRLAIRNFFDEAKERLHRPDFNKVGLPLIEHLKMDPEIHPHFYEITWDNLTIAIEGVNSFAMKVPSEKYGVLVCGDEYYSSYYYRLVIQPEDCPEEILNYFHRQKEMEEAMVALQEGAKEALTETTIKKALIRMPELKRFLPNETK